MIDFILRPFRRNFGKDKVFYAAIDDMFGFIPNNIELYKLALIHKSASITMEDGRQINNERLEYLGDAVIETVTSDYLFIEYPDMNEGFLTQLRSKMVSRQTLNDIAKRIGLDDHVISHTSASMSQKHIYGDAFEAMMGAIYLDQGYDFVNRLLINEIFTKYIKVENLAEAETDFKSRLIEWCQKNHHSIKFFTHNDKNYSVSHPFFYCKVLIDNIEVGYGAGDSKKEAEQRAAYSVAQGVSDADCTKLMDRLDTLETKQLLRGQDNSRAEKSAEQPKENDKKPNNQKTVEPKPELKPQPKPEVKAETKAEPKPEVKSEEKPVAKRESKPEVKPAPKKEPKQEKPQQDAVAEQENRAEVKVENSVEAKPKARRVRGGKSEQSKSEQPKQKASDKEPNAAADAAADTEKKDAKKSSARKPKAKRVEGKTESNTESNLDVNTDVKPKSAKRAENTAAEEKTAPEKSAKPKRTRSRAKSTASAEQTLNNIAEDVNALMAEVEKLTKNAQ